MGKRKRHTAEEKVKILIEVVEDGKQVSHVVEQYGPACSRQASPEQYLQPAQAAF